MSEKPGGDDLSAVLEQMESVSIEAAQNGSSLSFAGQSLKLDKEEDAKVIIDSINKVKNLTSLNLEGNTLGVNASKAIADSLTKHKHFKRALWKDMFTGRMKTEIPDALRFLGDGLQKAGARLVELDLSDNAFGPIGVEGLADLLRSSCCFALEELKLNNNGLGITGGKLLARSLLDCYERSKKEGKPLALKLFIAGRNRLENDGAKALANVFKTLKSLQEVQMPQNGIYHVGISALSEAFKENKNLAHLNLNDNTITHKGAVPLGKALSSLPSLKVLNLGDCLLKSAGAISIAESLQNSQHLEDLNFSCNEIALDGGVALAKAMQNKAHLKRINLSENQFGEEGVERIVKFMTSFNKGDALQLEDDEGICSDEEDGEEEEDHDEESEEDDSDAENDVSNVASPPTSPSSETHRTRCKQPSVGDFLNEPSYAVFDSLGPNCVRMFLDEINSEPEDRYLESMLLSIMKVSSILTSHSPSTNENKVFDCVKALYDELFTWASSPDKLSMVTNSLLVYLGLIKCEDKTFKISYNLAGCMFAIKRLCADKILPAQTESQLWACIKLKEEKRSTGSTAGTPVIDCY